MRRSLQVSLFYLLKFLVRWFVGREAIYHYVAHHYALYECECIGNSTPLLDINTLEIIQDSLKVTNARKRILKK